MRQNAGDKLHGGFAQAQFRVGVIERVFAVFHQRHIGVHTRTVDPENGLRHKGGMQAVTACIGLDNMLKGYHIVRGFEHFVKTEVDFVLAFGNLVVRSLDFIAHIFERQANVAAALFALVGGTHIEIACHIGGFGGGVAVFVKLEQEKFAFRTDIEGVTHIGGFFNHLFQNISRIAEERGFAVRTVDIADQAGNSVFPRQNDERIVIGAQIHIGLVDTHKALNRGAVKHTFVIQRFFQLAFGNGNIFHLPENIREL